MKKFRKNLKVLETPDENAPNPLEQSVFSQIGPGELKFIKDDIKVSTEGLTRISGEKDITMIQNMTKDDFEFSDVLGRGASGSVIKAKYLPLNVPVAIKTINIFEQEKRHQLMNDLKILIQAKTKAEQEGYIYCPFLVRLYGAYFDEGKVRIALELMDCGSLVDIIKKAKAVKKEEPLIEEPILARIAQQILNGLMYLHIVGHQIHRDIKPANILINSRGEVKLTDFGISKELDMTNQLASTQQGTVSYMSPERLLGKKYNYVSDIWSFGLIMIELATGKYPYPVNKAMVIIDMLDITSEYPSPNLPDNGLYSEDFRDFISRCMEKDPKKRATAVELLSHRWILKNLYQEVNLAAWLESLNNPLTEIKGNLQVIDEKDEMQKE